MSAYQRMKVTAVQELGDWHFTVEAVLRDGKGIPRTVVLDEYVTRLPVGTNPTAVTCLLLADAARVQKRRLKSEPRTSR